MPEFTFERTSSILLEDWLVPMGISQYALAKAIDVPPRRINETVKAKHGITRQ
jgi:plasmid maintenance system antidote protein VapI